MSRTLGARNRRGPVVLVSKGIEYAFPFSYAYLAGYLRQFGEDVRILFRPSPDHYDALVKEILNLDPVLIGFGSLYPDLRPVADLIARLKRAGNQAPTVVGGQMVSPIPEFAVKITGADLGVVGEGEITLLNLVRTLREGNNPSDVRGLAIRQGDEVILTGEGEFIEDLSKLPAVPFDLFPEDKWLPIGRFYTDKAQPHWRFNDRVIPVHGGRGCPFQCNFCYHHSRARYRSIEDMVGEAAEHLDRYKANFLYFGDDLVIATPKRAQQLARSLAQLGRRVEYSVSTRFDILERLDDELLRGLKDTGCRTMGLGIESGSQRVLDIMRKKITVEQIRSGLERIKNVGILPTVSIMVGQVSETVEDVEASIALMKDSVRNDRNIQYAFAITTPFPGSSLYGLALQNGYLKDHADFYERYRPDIGSFQLVANLSSMSDAELIAMHNKISRLYKEEKALATGSLVTRVESLRAVFHQGDRVMQSRLQSKFLSRSVLSVFWKLYRFLYDVTQKCLDKWRLRLLDISSMTERPD